MSKKRALAEVKAHAAQKNVKSLMAEDKDRINHTTELS
jgi:hypothetical protein